MNQETGFETLRPVPHDEQWFIFANDRHHGPFTFEEMRQKCLEGLLNRDSFVWHEGLPDWLPLKSVESLGSLVQVKNSADSADEAWSANIEELKGVDFVETAIEPTIADVEAPAAQIEQAARVEIDHETAADPRTSDEKFVWLEAFKTFTRVGVVLATALVVGMLLKVMNDLSAPVASDPVAASDATTSRPPTKTVAKPSETLVSETSSVAPPASSAKKNLSGPAKTQLKQFTVSLESRLNSTAREFDAIMRETRYSLPDRKARWTSASRKWKSEFSRFEAAARSRVAEMKVDTVDAPELAQFEAVLKDVAKVHASQTKYALSGRVDISVAAKISDEIASITTRLKTLRAGL